MFCVAVTYVVKEGHAEEAVEFLKKMTVETHKEPGNLMYIAHRSTTNPNQFFLYEQYNSEADLETHRNATYFQEYVVNGLIPVLESRTPEYYRPIE
jgi:quinol monooxygenase YgiN